MVPDVLCTCLEAHVVQACSRLRCERLVPDMELQSLIIWASYDLQARRRGFFR